MKNKLERKINKSKKLIKPILKIEKASVTSCLAQTKKKAMKFLLNDVIASSFITNG